MHGRSREQRYTKSADWDYIGQCAKLASPMPFFGKGCFSLLGRFLCLITKFIEFFFSRNFFWQGCGDVLSYVDANLRLSETAITGLMIARGALIKPWIFTEIREQRNWDISSKERLDILRDYVHFGLEHWGSDNEARVLLWWG